MGKWIPVDLLPQILAELSQGDLPAACLADRTFHRYGSEELYRHLYIAEGNLYAISDILCGPRDLGRKVQSLVLLHHRGNEWSDLDIANTEVRMRALNIALLHTPNIRKLDLRVLPVRQEIPKMLPIENCVFPHLRSYAFAVEFIDTVQIAFLLRHPSILYLAIEPYWQQDDELTQSLNLPPNCLPELVEIDVHHSLLRVLVPGRRIRKVRVRYNSMGGRFDPVLAIRSLALSVVPVQTFAVVPIFFSSIKDKAAIPELLSTVNHLILVYLTDISYLYHIISPLVREMPNIVHCTLHCQPRIDKKSFIDNWSRLFAHAPHLQQISIGWHEFDEERACLEPVETTELYSSQFDNESFRVWARRSSFYVPNDS